jgi:superfamily II DNA or RNA helicase
MGQLEGLPDGDRRIVERLMGARSAGGPFYGAYVDVLRFYLKGQFTDSLREICQTGRCLARVMSPPAAPIPSRRRRYWTPPPPPEPPQFHPLAWDDGGPWRFELDVSRDDTRHVYQLRGALVRDSERLGLADALLIFPDGLFATASLLGRTAVRGGFNWLAILRANGPLEVPCSARSELIEALLPAADALTAAPEELRATMEDGQPKPWLHLTAERYGARRVVGALHFEYGGQQVHAGSPHGYVRSSDPSRFVRRDPDAERVFHDTLGRVGFRDEYRIDHGGRAPHLAAHRMPGAIRALIAEGWGVVADGLRYRQPGTVALSVTSGIDWFDLEGHVDYGDQRLALPALLSALRSGSPYVMLGDGSMGLLPEDWLRTHGLLARLGTAHGDVLRFKRSQATLLDALLAAQPVATCDETFARARSELQRFDGIAPADPPSSFQGTLREYQREGVGWLMFLRQFGFGGCLADDMGLGKTVMVLALLARHRAEAPEGTAPSLVVAPRSLVFNWRQEAARFTPGLRVLDYTGLGRASSRSRFSEADVVLTTYGTLRRDAAALSEVEFDYVVLDESQAIKNAVSASAKAARLLRARHRLALSGTPVENHLGELWSLFEFLNPGVLGSSAAFERTSGGRPDDGALAALTRVLRPFILRRTKSQVAPELPAKTEQTIHCELEGPQRKLYNELRDHYRLTLLAKTNGGGLGRVKLQVLEALLRLRQAACHPGLIDPKRKDDDSAKLDVLVPHVTQAVDEGHKTLVFSQFTSLLAILRQRLDAAGVDYEYLDGRTRDREPRVTRFQTDPACRLFLISLKAGGLGLNLTAAEYVFLLDPWWNPAVEAHAIDRAHRIGQTRQVFAYRLIARDTVEERVLELQQQKRALADAILAADGGLIRDLRREDLERLLS